MAEKNQGLVIDENTKIPLFTAITVTIAVVAFTIPLIAAYSFVQSDHKKISKHDRILLAVIYSQMRVENHLGTLPEKNPFKEFLDKENED